MKINIQGKYIKCKRINEVYKNIYIHTHIFMNKYITIYKYINT